MEREKVLVRRVVRSEKLREMTVDHAYLSAGDTPHVSGDRGYAGCVICGRSRSEHA